jgi:hypothetical protein
MSSPSAEPYRQPGTYWAPAGGPIEAMACAVCGHVVDTRTQEVGSAEVSRTWTHNMASADDHVVVPVPVDWIRTNFRCDFCLTDEARWSLPVEKYEVVSGYMNEDDWAACDICAAALRARDWNKIIYRAVQAHKRVNPELPVPREHFAVMYQQLKTHILGPVHLRIEEPSKGEADA